MGTPQNLGSLYHSLYDWSGLSVQRYIRENYDAANTAILDVGAGWGKYRFLLPEYRMEGVEIFAEYVAKNRLADFYDTMHVRDVRDMEFDWYDVIIMGDVLEHMRPLAAQDLLKYMWPRCKDIVVVVPYEYPQGEEEGNLYEIHLQEDLTTEVMQKRFPWLTLYAEADGKGIYVKRRLE